MGNPSKSQRRDFSILIALVVLSLFGAAISNITETVSPYNYDITIGEYQSIVSFKSKGMFTGSRTDLRNALLEVSEDNLLVFSHKGKSIRVYVSEHPISIVDIEREFWGENVYKLHVSLELDK